MVSVHKKCGKSLVQNDQPVSLLPTLSKILESVVVAKVTEHLKKAPFLCSQLFRLRLGQSETDLHLLLVSE